MSTPVWETKSKETLRTFLKTNLKSLKALADREAVEADTRTFVTDLLVEGLSYDKYEELTAEYLVKGEFADIGIKVDKKLLAFVEIKRIGLDLKDTHLRQVKNYAANEGVEWVILTNGRNWQVYHISNTTPIEHELLFQVDLLGDGSPAEKVAQLWQISKAAMVKGVINETWQSAAAVNNVSIKSALLSDSVLIAVRKEIRARTKQLVDVKKLKEIISSEFK
jgi:predicted type IV restriction endonuclease